MKGSDFKIFTKIKYYIDELNRNLYCSSSKRWRIDIDIGYMVTLGSSKRWRIDIDIGYMVTLG